MSNQLEVIIKESGLEKTKADYLIENFKTCFDFAKEWKAKAKTIVVTSPDQKADMAMARFGRLELREKRIAIENSRKKLKEDILKEGKTIDGIATMLKGLIEPIEAYLDEQEHFVEIEAKKKEDAHRAEVEKRMAAEEETRIKAEAEKTEKLKAENERLIKQNAVAKAKLDQERAKAKEAADKAEAVAAAIKGKADAEKKAIEDKARAEREKAEEAQRKAKELAKKKLDAEREENERLEALLKAQVTCPKCSHKFVPVK